MGLWCLILVFFFYELQSSISFLIKRLVNPSFFNSFFFFFPSLKNNNIKKKKYIDWGKEDIYSLNLTWGWFYFIYKDPFIYLSSNISSTESNVNIWLGKLGTAIGRLSIIWKSAKIGNLSNYGCVSTIIWSHHWGSNKMPGDRIGTTQGCCVLFWMNSGRSILQYSSCMATYLPSNKSSK